MNPCSLIFVVEFLFVYVLFLGIGVDSGYGQKQLELCKQIWRVCEFTMS